MQKEIIEKTKPQSAKEYFYTIQQHLFKYGHHVKILDFADTGVRTYPQDPELLVLRFLHCWKTNLIVVIVFVMSSCIL